MIRIKKKPFRTIGFLLICASVIVRIYLFPFSNSDLETYNLKWYASLAQNGIAQTLATNFTNYSPPYTYLLAAASLFKNWIPPLISLKLIPTFFDVLGMYLVYKIAKIKYPQEDLPYLAAAVYFVAPTVVINSSYWGQVDSFYTCFLLLCLYCVLTDKAACSMAAFGLALSIKAQAVFFVPFLLVMFIRRKIPWSYIWIPAFIYLLAIAPVVLLGRDFADALLVYVRQADSYRVLSANSPNFYVFLPRNLYGAIAPLGAGLAICSMLLWVSSASKTTAKLSADAMILLAVLSAALMPFLLPKMHDRYFYPVDVLSILLAFSMPNLWFVALFSQLISLGATSVFLFGANDSFLFCAALLNAFSIAVLVRAQKQSGLLQPVVFQHLFEKMYQYAWVVATPIILLGMAANLFISPAFFRAHNRLFNTASNPTLPGNQEKNQKVGRVFQYLYGEIEVENLYHKDPSFNQVVLSKDEAYDLQDIKQTWSRMIQIWDFSLLAAYLICLLAWAGDGLAAVRRGLRIGGFLTGLIAAAGVVALLIFFGRGASFQAPFSQPTLSILFTKQMLFESAGLLLVFACACGFALGLGLPSKE